MPHNDRRAISDAYADPDPSLAGIVMDFVTRPTYVPHATPYGWRRHSIRLRHIAVAAMLFAAAVGARMPLILRGQTMLHSDECIVGLMSQDIAAGARLPIFFYGQRYMGALEAYVIAALRPCVGDPLIALRLGPALFFGALVAIQFLMLTRWFGARPALAGALALIASSPMFAQWSISARGGYVEVLLWGSAVWWAYSEWFVPPRAVKASRACMGLFGLLIGSGMWINPAIMLFVVPVAAHALLNRPLAAVRAACHTNPPMARIERRLRHSILALPVLGIVLVLLLTGLSSTWVEQGVVHHTRWWNLLPASLGRVIAGVVVVAAAAGLWQFGGGLASWRARAASAMPFIVGLLIGQAPMMIYVVTQTLSGAGVEPAVPLGLRPIMQTGDTFMYLLAGLPLLFGANAAGYMNLVLVGHDYSLRPLPEITQAALATATWMVAGAWLTIGVVFTWRYRFSLARICRLAPSVHAPAAFLFLAAAGMVCLYLLGASVVDFNSIRYLVPVWAVAPGIVAAVWCKTGDGPRMAVAPEQARRASIRVGRASIIALLALYGGGQFAYAARLGEPHPLAGVAASLRTSGISSCVGEIFDAHVLSFLTDQQVRIVEFQPFWPRLLHYRKSSGDGATATTYLVDTTSRDWSEQWRRTQHPGPPPPETQRVLLPYLRQLVQSDPKRFVARMRLCEGYELWRIEDHAAK